MSSTVFAAGFAAALAADADTDTYTSQAAALTTPGVFTSLLVALPLLGALCLWLISFMPHLLLTVATTLLADWARGRRACDTNDDEMDKVMGNSIVLYLIVSLLALAVEEPVTVTAELITLSHALMQSAVVHGAIAVGFVLYGAGWRIARHFQKKDAVKVAEDGCSETTPLARAEA
ncbi:hypothetical protein CLAFUW4_10782 [Fulvia fulva]|uniref:Uncharacterized protein n=1 Tax=Passalora fulva TaxID=5499 RepID=A0A9Q8PCB5_PASFU|nr:uncharacterized protein CLAFUR5_09825 [Fulvia fulva]KAK4619918.1 hypothetical protein CLAFUR4_10787 [Fulvia fulva]KAK4620611.1 hypothetical protein CLAFUR0_10794 [Fulvia fulva]UJO19849.1 hypothetical protein CLAFUR5_09825 [Fulvia fulva]WPV17615.1 hypothetical protein CLAFUW4_10782 [Fulvia fulva]WPV32703.1 hypothetical protein CLAFUW7_10780 [Fulvia fulva]